jgi:hypothetical protein
MGQDEKDRAYSTLGTPSAPNNIKMDLKEIGCLNSAVSGEDDV